MLVKEELVQYLIKGYIHVSRQDYLFFNNLCKFSNEGSITTGQDKLLNKLIDKYQKQLKRENFNIEELKKLPWLQPLLQTKDEYRFARVSIVNKEIIIKNPFSKKFMQDLHHLGTLNTFDWDKVHKVYRSPFSSFALKNAIELTAKNFDEVKFCDIIKQILEEVNQYKDCYWDPTLICTNGKYFIAACNASLNEHLHNIELSNDPYCLFALNKLGINIDSDIITSEMLKFASSNHYSIDIEETDNLIDWLKILKVSNVLVETQAIYTNSLYKELKNKLEDNGINILSIRDIYDNVDGTEYPIILSFRTHMTRIKLVDNKKTGKIVTIKNSRPIQIK